MKKYQLFSLTGLVLLILVTVSLTSHSVPVQLKDNKGFAVVELFTSEGCSSCPPADEAVARLQQENNDNVFVLGFHVDYWNHLGWKDEYSNAAFTKRQGLYAENFNLNSIYTPQVIVNGKKEFVGSDESQLRKTVEQQLKETSQANIALSAKSTGNHTIDVTFNAGNNNGTVTNIALVQREAVSSVKRGENEGKELKHINLVRDFKSIGGSEGKTTLSLPAGINEKNCFVVAYCQNKNDLQITAAAKAAIQ